MLGAIVYGWDLWHGQPMIRLGPKSYAALVVTIVVQMAALLLASRARSGTRLGRLGEGITVSLASTVILLTCFEVALRAAGYGERDARFGRSLEIVHAPYEQGVEGGMPYRLNSMGFRDDELPPMRAPGEIRVLCLGDSSTFGFWVSQDEAYPQELERILRERTGRPAQVINGGFVGATSYQGWLLFEKVAPALDLDWVVAAFGHNDRWLRPLSDAKGGTGRAMACLLQSRIVVLLEKVLAPLRRARQDRYVPRVSPLEHEGNLAAIARLAASRGTRALFLSLPENPAMDEAPARARKLVRAGKPMEALATLAPVTRKAALDPYPDAFELEAEIAATLVRPRIAAQAREEAAVRHRLAPRLRDQAPYRAALLAAARATGSRSVVFDPACLAGKFLDICHPTPAFHAEIARALADAITGEGVGCCPCPADP